MQKPQCLQLRLEGSSLISSPGFASASLPKTILPGFEMPTFDVYSDLITPGDFKANPSSLLRPGTRSRQKKKKKRWGNAFFSSVINKMHPEHASCCESLQTKMEAAGNTNSAFIINRPYFLFIHTPPKITYKWEPSLRSSGVLWRCAGAVTRNGDMKEAREDEFIQKKKRS